MAQHLSQDYTFLLFSGLPVFPYRLPSHIKRSFPMPAQVRIVRLCLDANSPWQGCMHNYIKIGRLRISPQLQYAIPHLFIRNQSPIQVEGSISFAIHCMPLLWFTTLTGAHRLSLFLISLVKLVKTKKRERGRERKEKQRKRKLRERGDRK